MVIDAFKDIDLPLREGNEKSANARSSSLVSTWCGQSSPKVQTAGQVLRRDETGLNTKQNRIHPPTPLRHVTNIESERIRETLQPPPRGKLKI